MSRSTAGEDFVWFFLGFFCKKPAAAPHLEIFIAKMSLANYAACSKGRQKPQKSRTQEKSVTVSQ